MHKNIGLPLVFCIILISFVVQNDTIDPSKYGTLINVFTSFNGTPVLSPKNRSQEEILLTDSEVHTWSSPDPYFESHTLIIKAESGYKISIAITKCDIEGDDGDFLLIKSGSSVEEEGTGRIFTFNLDESRRYIFLSNIILIDFEVFGDNAKKRSGFTIEYQRHGEFVTTTESPTTGIPWPTPPSHYHIYLRVNISGISDKDFAQEAVLNSFKSATAGMAAEYCHLQNIILEKEITINNTHIQEAVRCPMSWENYEKCVQIQFALPVFVNDSATAEEWRGYQLTADHLRQMWIRLSHKYLPTYGFSIYEEPNFDKAMSVWIAIIVIVIIVVIILLGLILFYSNKTALVSRRMSDVTAIISSKRSSNISLGPPPSQSIPPLFENDFPFHEPNSSKIHAEFRQYDEDTTDDETENVYNITGLDREKTESHT